MLTLRYSQPIGFVLIGAGLPLHSTMPTIWPRLVGHTTTALPTTMVRIRHSFALSFAPMALGDTGTQLEGCVSISAHPVSKAMTPQARESAFQSVPLSLTDMLIWTWGFVSICVMTLSTGILTLEIAFPSADHHQLISHTSPQEDAYKNAHTVTLLMIVLMWENANQLLTYALDDSEMRIKESVWVCVQGLRQSTLSDLGQIVFHVNYLHNSDCPNGTYADSYTGTRLCVQYCPPGVLNSVTAPNLYGDPTTHTCVAKCITPHTWADRQTRLCEPTCSATPTPTYS